MEKNIQAQLDRIEQLTLLGVKNILTVHEAAQYIGRTINTLYVMCSRRQIPYYKQGKQNFFKKSELDEWMTSQKVETASLINERANKYLIKTK